MQGFFSPEIFQWRNKMLQGTLEVFLNDLLKVYILKENDISAPLLTLFNLLHGVETWPNFFQHKN